MNRFVITFVMVALASILIANWGMNRLFSQTLDIEPEQEQFDQQLGRVLALSFDNSDKPRALIDKLDQDDIDLSLVSLTQLNLPESLRQQLLDENQLVLQSSVEITYYYPIKENSQVLVISRKVTGPAASLPRQLFFTLIFYACIVGALLIWARPLIKRLINLRRATRAFGEGELHQRLEEGSSLYISDIEREFNRMADRIEILIADNKLLSNAVSHDLKTPLARLRFGFDVLQETENQEQRQKYLDKISRDLQEMEALVDTLLCYARLDQAKLELHRDKVDLVAFINELLATMDFDTVTVDWSAPQSAHYVVGDKRYLSLLLNNLVLNACQHARHSIAIKLERSVNTGRLIIEDDGPGIPTNQRQAVLKPFVRGDADRGAPGHGMGLAIVNRIIHWHHWGLAIGDSSTLGGAQVEVTIS